MIDSMIEKIILEIGVNPKIILTGGLSSIVYQALNINCEFIENLTLIGLEEIFNLNN
jgi:pantothenate kinase type III